MIAMPRKSKLDLPPLDLGEETIGDRLARLRKERGLTQVELAKKTGLIQVLISEYERNKLRLNADMIVRFAKALDVTTDEILGFKNRQTDVSSPSLKVLRRLKKIEALPSSQQKALLRTIDTFLKGAESIVRS